jgi:hypothetical protein
VSNWKVQKSERLERKQAIIEYLKTQTHRYVQMSELIEKVDIIWVNTTKSIMSDPEFECKRLARMQNLKLPQYGYKLKENYLKSVG